MLRFRSGMAGLRLGKFQILAPPRHHCGGRLRVKSSQDLEKSSRSHSPAHAHRHYNVPNASPLSFQERSEEHTSELQSPMRIPYAVLCLKKKKQINHNKT